MYTVAVVFLISVGIYFLPVSPLFEGGVVVLLILQLMLGYLGYGVGHSGGELVYKHGAANAYIQKGATGAYDTGEYEEDEHEYEEDDD